LQEIQFETATNAALIFAVMRPLPTGFADWAHSNVLLEMKMKALMWGARS
jgi:hypothetical protein